MIGQAEENNGCTYLLQRLLYLVNMTYMMLQPEQDQQVRTVYLHSLRQYRVSRAHYIVPHPSLSMHPSHLPSYLPSPQFYIHQTNPTHLITNPPPTHSPAKTPRTPASAPNSALDLPASTIPASADRSRTGADARRWCCGRRTGRCA